MTVSLKGCRVIVMGSLISLGHRMGCMEDMMAGRFIVTQMGLINSIFNKETL
jgi:hypothetical protein